MKTVGKVVADYHEIDKIDYGDLAKAVLKMAKHVNRVRPDVILLPLRSGYVTGKLVVEALRCNLGVSPVSYDPPVIYTFMNHRPECDPRIDLKKLKSMHPDLKKIMIIDSTNQGLSPSLYLEHLTESNEFGKIYVNLMGADYPVIQKEKLERFDGKLKIRITRLRSKEIPFDDRSNIIGITEYPEYNDITKRNSYNYFPYGSLHYQGLSESQKTSEEFFLRCFRALRRAK